MNKAQTLLQRPGFRYLIIGGSVYVLELAIIVLAEYWGASGPWAVAISFIIGTAVSFLLQKVITFSDRRMHHKVLIPQIIATALLICWNLAFSVVLTSALEDHWPAVVTRTVALAITTIWNFYLYKTKIFNQDIEPIV
jgi:putative flippase GtrA